MSNNKAPSQQGVNDAPPPPGAPAPNPIPPAQRTLRDALGIRKEFHRKADTEESGPNFAGRYRVREGYSIAHGKRTDEGNKDSKTVGPHNLALPGDVVELTHEDAKSIIKFTLEARDHEGRRIGPAIETEEMFEQRHAAEAQAEAFRAALAG